MTALSAFDFKQNHQTHLKHLKFKGLQPKTVEAYARAIRRSVCLWRPVHQLPGLLFHPQQPWPAIQGADLRLQAAVCVLMVIWF